MVREPGPIGLVRTLLWACHVASMPENHVPKRLMMLWVRKPRIAGKTKRHLQHACLVHADGSALVFTEWATLAQGRAG